MIPWGFLRILHQEIREAGDIACSTACAGIIVDLPNVLQVVAIIRDGGGSLHRRLRVKGKANAADVDTIARHGLRHPPLGAGSADAGHGEEAIAQHKSLQIVFCKSCCKKQNLVLQKVFRYIRPYFNGVLFMPNSHNQLLVYFDTNVFSDLAEKRIANSDKILTTLKRKTLSTELVICPSFELCTEIILVSQRFPTKYTRLYNLFCALANWNYLLRPSNDILTDDILTFAKLRPASYFMQPRDKHYWFVKEMRNGRQVFSDLELNEICRQTRNEKEIFTDIALRPFTQSKLRKMRANQRKSRENKDETFLSFWRENGTAENIAADFARHLGVYSECQKYGMHKLLAIPTIRLAVGYVLYCWYKQVLVNSREKSSSAYDFRHVICAGAIGNIVTHDRRLRETINNIPGHNVSAWSLNDLISIFK